MDYKNLELESRDRIKWVTLNRPHRLNALSHDLNVELRDFFGSLSDDAETRVVIIRGAGRGFCSGMDFKASAERRVETTERHTAVDAMKEQEILADVIVRMRQCPQPIIGAIRGPAVGGGLSLALACDIRIASESARFRAAYILVGLSGTDLGSSYFLPRIIGMGRAFEYLYTGDWIDATTAERFGLVSRVVPDDQLDQAAIELAQKLLLTTPFGLKMTKQVLNVNVDAPSLFAAAQMENRNQILTAQTEDYSEASRAFFFEKRPPVYKDR